MNFLLLCWIFFIDAVHDQSAQAPQAAIMPLAPMSEKEEKKLVCDIAKQMGLKVKDFYMKTLHLTIYHIYNGLGY